MSLQKLNPNSSPKVRELNRTRFECTYCHKNYTRENAYLAHACPVKARQDQVKSPLGQASYMFYAKWMHTTKRSIPVIDTFAQSKFYESFIKFARFVKAVKLPSVDVYIQVMNSKNITPELWTDDRAYAIYLEHMEYHIDPLVSINITTKVLRNIADEYECDTKDVFTKCFKNEIIQYIRERKLSPWVLLKSQKFGRFIEECSDEQLEIVEHLIDANFWRKKFKAHPDVLVKVAERIKELGI